MKGGQSGAKRTKLILFCSGGEIRLRERKRDDRTRKVLDREG